MFHPARLLALLFVLLPLQSALPASGDPTGIPRDPLRRARGQGTEALGDVSDSPLELKKGAGLRLLQLRDAIHCGAHDGVGNRKRAVHEIDDAIEELLKSLDGKFWLHEGNLFDPRRLDPRHGHHVFYYERDSAYDIFDAICEGKIHEGDLRTALLEVVDTLVEADRRLANRAIRDAEAAGGDEDDIEEAKEKLAEGDELVAEAAETSSLSRKESRLLKAINHAYRDSWEAAIDAVR